MSGPMVVYGMGATKAGTSWLHSYLSSHPDCHFRQLKELHYFDMLERGPRNRVANLQKFVGKLEGKARLATAERKVKLERRICDIQAWLTLVDGDLPNDAAYLDYLMSGADEDTRVIGDITPAYAALSEDRFKQMAGVSAETKFIYLLRDPLDRAWSHIRMNAKKKAGDQPLRVAKIAARQMDRFIAGDLRGVDARSDYAGSIERLLAVVPRENVLIAFFEDLFTNKAVERITEFLGVRPMQADLEKIVHVGGAVALDAGCKQAATRLLQPQYEFVTEYFAGQVPARWNTNMAGV